MNDTRPTVWVLKEQASRSASSATMTMDYTPAYQFGDVRFITEFDIPLVAKSSMARKWMASVSQFLRQYDPERDFVILTGAPVAMFMLGTLMAMHSIAPKMLVWRREQGGYVVYDPLEMLELEPPTLNQVEIKYVR